MMRSHRSDDDPATDFSDERGERGGIANIVIGVLLAASCSVAGASLVWVNSVSTRLTAREVLDDVNAKQRDELNVTIRELAAKVDGLGTQVAVLNRVLQDQDDRARASGTGRPWTGTPTFPSQFQGSGVGK